MRQYKAGCSVRRMAEAESAIGMFFACKRGLLPVYFPNWQRLNGDLRSSQLQVGRWPPSRAQAASALTWSSFEIALTSNMSPDQACCGGHVSDHLAALLTNYLPPVLPDNRRTFQLRRVKRHPSRLKNKMIEAWKKQFSLEQLSLEHDKPITFVISQWQRKPKPSVCYLVYRWAIAIIFFVTFVISIIDLKHPDAPSSFKAKWLIYLTNWGYTTCTLQALLAAIILSICVLAPYLHSKPHLESSALKWYKLYWVCNVVATDIAFGVTSLYWSLIYDEKTMDLDAMNFFVHANNSILMMIDLFVVAHPIRLLHCCYPIVFGSCYALFSVIFYAAGGISREGKDYIYNILNWNKPGITTAVCIAVLAFIVIVHIICWALHKFRIWLHSECLAKRHAELSQEHAGPAKGAYVNEGLASDMV